MILLFKSGVYSLDSTQINNLDRFPLSVSNIKRITGYADSVGSITSNRKLSYLRALSVSRISQRHQLLPLQPDFKGEEFIPSPDLSLNRKVEITGRLKIPDQILLPPPSDSIVADFDISDVQFIPDRPIITPESMSSIGLLVEQLRNYPHAHFDIIGHVNYQSNTDTAFLQDLFKLSVARAKVIYDLLIDNGIPSSILNYTGVGNTQPLIKEPVDDDERKRNMRVQILVIRSPAQSGN